MAVRTSVFDLRSFETTVFARLLGGPPQTARSQPTLEEARGTYEQRGGSGM